MKDKAKQAVPGTGQYGPVISGRSALCLALLIGLSLAACQTFAPPRLATATAQAANTPTSTAVPLRLVAPTPTAESARVNSDPVLQTEPNPSLTVWINETSAEHEATLAAMMDEFTAMNQIDVELVLVSPLLLPELVNTAVLSDTLPDVILHPMEFTAGWVERGILDAAVADEAVTQIGRDTFDPAALSIVDIGGMTAALPSDGYHQILVYRADWFAQRGLNTPDNFAAMFAAAEATIDRDNLVSGFVIPTEANLVTTHQGFEHLALANGCELIDDQGEVRLLEPACAEALDFYFRIVNQFSPIGVQTDTSTRNAYLAGRTGMVIVSPDMLAGLAGLGATPPCPECVINPSFLAENSGIVTHITGTGNQATPTSFGEMTVLGMTSVADRQTAVSFADYWFNQGYEQWLAVETERKVPMRWGTQAAPRRFIDAWGTHPIGDSEQSLQDIYGADIVAQLREGIAASPRWGIPQGQGALVTQIYEQLTLSVILQEMLSGYFGSEQTIMEAYHQIIELIPDYQFLPAVEG